MTLKVLHVIDHLGYGGAPLVVRNIVKRLDRSLIEPSVCALRSNLNSIDIDADVINLNCHRYGFAAIGAIKRLCNERGIDIVHAHLQKSIICSLLSGSTVPVVIHEHGGILRMDYMGWIYRLLLKALKRRICAAIGISRVTTEKLQYVTGLSPEQIIMNPNFIDTERFVPERYNRNRIRHYWSMPDDKMVLGFVGRLDQCKGADLLIEAVALLVQQGISCHAIIVGQGNQYRALQRQINLLDLQGKVTLAGLAENPAEWMAGFDIGVVPSRREGFGVVATEYMAMGVPLVATETGGLLEIIEHKTTGLLAPVDSAPDLANAIRTLIQDEDLRESLRKNALIQVKQFNGDTQIFRIEKLYRDLVRVRV